MPAVFNWIRGPFGFCTIEFTLQKVAISLFLFCFFHPLYSSVTFLSANIGSARLRADSILLCTVFIRFIAVSIICWLNVVRSRIALYFIFSWSVTFIKMMWQHYMFQNYIDLGLIIMLLIYRFFIPLTKI